jgi:GTPase Era involved in 16S rRNA processing
VNPAESPFVAIARIVGEATNGFDTLRIIAKDTPGLSQEDRRNIRDAADELENSQRAHLQTYAQLIDTQRQLTAVHERLLETTQRLLQTKKPVFPLFPKLQMSSGWVTVIMQSPTIPPRSK